MPKSSDISAILAFPSNKVLTSSIDTLFVSKYWSSSFEILSSSNQDNSSIPTLSSS